MSYIVAYDHQQLGRGWQMVPTFNEAIAILNRLEERGYLIHHIAKMMVPTSDVVDLRNRKPCPTCKQPMEYRATYYVEGGDPNIGSRVDYCPICKKSIQNAVDRRGPSLP